MKALATTRITAAAVAAALSFGASCHAAEAPQFDIKGVPGFVESLGLPAGEAVPADMEAQKKALTGIFNDKALQHSLTKHFAKGHSCVTCHDQQGTDGGPAWMLKVTNPPIKQQCGDCHTVQKETAGLTDTHSKLDCIACHMPNVSVGASEGEKGKLEAIRRLHAYKIEVDPKATTYVKDEKGAWKLATNEDGNVFTDIVWSCGRTAPADYTTFGDAKGCHSPSTSTLEEGLVYRDQAAIYGEIEKWQKPVKEGWKKAAGDVRRLRKLLGVTLLKPEDQTEARLLLDKAQDIVRQVEKDGSWGVHAPNYLKDRVATARSYTAKAEKILDEGDYAVHGLK